MAMFGGTNRLPGTSQLHSWADWFEILAYTSALGEFSVTEFTETVERREDYFGVESVDDMDDAARGKDPLAGFRGADLRDRVAGRGEDVLRYMSARQQEYGRYYPFSVDEDEGTVRVEALDKARTLYLFLLACSSLRYIPNRSDRSKLTSAFELLSLKAIESYLPKRSKAYVFGKNALLSSSAAPGPYASGSLIEKIRRLSVDLGEISLVKETDFERHDNGDNGLDIVAWHDMGDALGGRILYFAQCACTSDWVSKQHSASHDAWSSVMTFTARPVSMCFIPHDYRLPDRNWYTKRHVHNVVLIDRIRILRALTEDEWSESAGPTFETEMEGFMLFDELTRSFAQDLQDI